MELLERTSLLDELGEFAAAARQGDGRLVLVSAESGIGKTALDLLRFAGRPRARYSRRPT
jgi:hypothetical protein